MARTKYLVKLILVILVFSATVIIHKQQFLGRSVEAWLNPPQAETQVVATIGPNGLTQYHSNTLANQICGYAGPIHLDLHVQDGTIKQVVITDHMETPPFMALLEKKGFIQQWQGKTLETAVTFAPDAISGATMSSNCITHTIQLTAAYGAKVEAAKPPQLQFTWKLLAALLVIIWGLWCTFKPLKSRPGQVLYLLMNVGIVGFWSGTFLSLSQFTNWLTHGIHLGTTLLPLCLLLITVILPLFKRKGTFCAMHCPLGSLQVLVGKLSPRKLILSPRVTKPLNQLRDLLLLALLLSLWAGFGFFLLDYELFTLFMIEVAPPLILSLGALVILLSIFIPRPYCRFICPTGALISWTQK